MSLLWVVVKIVVLVVVVGEVVCFVVALYEMLNLPDVRDVRLTAAGLLGATRGLVVEIAAAVITVLATPLGALPWRRLPQDLACDATIIVFVPGHFGTRAALWPLRRALARAGWSHAVGYNYRSVAGDLHAAARGLATVIDGLRERHGAHGVVVVAHGMGGLVARLCLRAREGRDVLALITLGTPHQGSKLAVLALDRMAQEMRPGSALVEELAEADPLPSRLEVIAIYAGFDLMVLPASAGRYQGASSIEVEGVGHLGMLWSRRVAELVRENLDFIRDNAAAQGAPSAATQRATSSASE